MPPVVEEPLVVLHADEALTVVVKPRELLSCPGTTTPDWDSVVRRVQGGLLVHRLDAPTSGLMVVALTPDAQRRLSMQFAQREVTKAYEALLDGHVAEDEGIIDLPMRSEWKLRPRQVIDRAHGKPALTRWRVLARDGARTRVRFEPVTGRTHQLRLHALEGLGVPIVGDRIYGTGGIGTLCLHASELRFTHPITRGPLSFVSLPDF